MEGICMNNADPDNKLEKLPVRRQDHKHDEKDLQIQGTHLVPLLHGRELVTFLNFATDKFRKERSRIGWTTHLPRFSLVQESYDSRIHYPNKPTIPSLGLPTAAASEILTAAPESRSKAGYRKNEGGGKMKGIDLLQNLKHPPVMSD